MVKIQAFIILLGLVLTFQSLAAEPAPGLREILQNTVWEGSLTSSQGIFPMRIGFLQELFNGKLLYFHKAVGLGEGGEVVRHLDTACDFTPRSLTLNPPDANGIYSGEITLFFCATSLPRELFLESRRHRLPMAPPIEVRAITLRRDGHLMIAAVIAGEIVNYDLTQPPMGTVNSRDRVDLKKWVDQLQ